MPFNLFRRKKEAEPQQQADSLPPDEPGKEPSAPAAPEPEPATETPIEAESNAMPPELKEDVLQTPEPAAEPQKETAEAEKEESVQAAEPKAEGEAAPASKTYLKAMPLKEFSDIEKVKDEVRSGNIIILKVTPLATKSIDDVKNAVNELFQFAESIGGDIARLGEERMVICPKTVRIWREKTPAPVSTGSEPLPTAA